MTKIRVMYHESCRYVGCPVICSLWNSRVVGVMSHESEAGKSDVL